MCAKKLFCFGAILLFSISFSDGSKVKLIANGTKTIRKDGMTREITKYIVVPENENESLDNLSNELNDLINEHVEDVTSKNKASYKVYKLTQDFLKDKDDTTSKVFFEHDNSNQINSLNQNSMYHTYKNYAIGTHGAVVSNNNIGVEEIQKNTFRNSNAPKKTVMKYNMIYKTKPKENTTINIFNNTDITTIGSQGEISVQDTSNSDNIRLIKGIADDGVDDNRMYNDVKTQTVILSEKDDAMKIPTFVVPDNDSQVEVHNIEVPENTVRKNQRFQNKYNNDNISVQTIIDDNRKESDGKQTIIGVVEDSNNVRINPEINISEEFETKFKQLKPNQNLKSIDSTIIADPSVISSQTSGTELVINTEQNDETLKSSQENANIKELTSSYSDNLNVNGESKSEAIISSESLNDKEWNNVINTEAHATWYLQNKSGGTEEPAIEIESKLNLEQNNLHSLSENSNDHQVHKKRIVSGHDIESRESNDESSKYVQWYNPPKESIEDFRNTSTIPDINYYQTRTYISNDHTNSFEKEKLNGKTDNTDINKTQKNHSEFYYDYEVPPKDNRENHVKLTSMVKPERFSTGYFDILDEAFPKSIKQHNVKTEMPYDSNLNIDGQDKQYIDTISDNINYYLANSSLKEQSAEAKNSQPVFHGTYMIPAKTVYHFLVKKYPWLAQNIYKQANTINYNGDSVNKLDDQKQANDDDDDKILRYILYKKLSHASPKHKLLDDADVSKSKEAYMMQNNLNHGRRIQIVNIPKYQRETIAANNDLNNNIPFNSDGVIFNNLDWSKDNVVNNKDNRINLDRRYDLNSYNDLNVELKHRAVVELKFNLVRLKLLLADAYLLTNNDNKGGTEYYINMLYNNILNYIVYLDSVGVQKPFINQVILNIRQRLINRVITFNNLTEGKYCSYC